ncbi:hypothetical protein [Microcoleus sp. herbarium12]|uniref:hypothetical protein n=1 Tax=Microcoleus sp. herbarium12 TaxID=3055437 RepID=UPI002FCFB745
MGNGEWGMGDGEWGMGNGNRGMGNRGMGNGELVTKDNRQLTIVAGFNPNSQKKYYPFTIIYWY